MTSSSKTSGGPRCCPVCSAPTSADDSGGDENAICSQCGVRIAAAEILMARLETLARQHPGLELMTITGESPWPLGGDSLTAVEVMLALEQELGVSITAHEAERIYTVGEAIRYFELRLRQQGLHETARP